MACGHIEVMRGRRCRITSHCLHWRLVVLAFVVLAAAGTARPAAAYDEATAARLLQELADQEPKVRERAAYELGKLRPAQAAWVQRLIAAADDVDPQVRRGAVWALGQVDASQDQAVKKLLAVLASDVAPKNRIEAIQALGNLSDAARDAVPALEAVARGGRGIHGVQPFLPTRRMLPLKFNVPIRSDAIRALGKIGSEDAIGILAIVLIQAEKELHGAGLSYYVLSAEALARIGRADSRIMPALERGRRLPGTSPALQKARVAADSALRQIEAQEAKRTASPSDQPASRP